ncbi:MAG TPA: sugar ABC transporter permease [Candidatus Atribacteria bacterium]|nr:sugar ABC transporter permease [Candidatus Atribacteria bacterium]HPT77560.1 sugar ABC transporter permease [Candidatus Atribacteria bacterium]
MTSKGKGRRRVPYEVRKQRAGYVFILPWILGFLFFFAEPMIESIIFSFSDVTAGQSGLVTKFVGLANYEMVLVKTDEFLRYLWTAVVNMLSEIAIIPLFSLFIALILNQKFRGRTVYRAIYFLPVIMTSGVVFTMMSGVMSSSLSGTQNAYFQSTGLMNILIQGNVPMSLVNFITSVVDRIFSLTLKCGVQILLFLSGLQKIPASSYEACKIEGATAWDSFWKITFPLILPMMMLNIVYTIIDSFTAYGTQEAGNVVMAYIYRIGFGKSMKFGLSAAMAWLYFIVIILFLTVAYLVVGRKASRIES